MLHFSWRHSLLVRRFASILIVGGAIFTFFPEKTIAQFYSGSGSMSSGSSSNGNSSGDAGSSLNGGSDSGSASGAAGASGSDSQVDGVGKRLILVNPVMTNKLAFKNNHEPNRKQRLIKEFRFEFAKRRIIEEASKLEFDALKANRLLDQFSTELDNGLIRPNDLKSLGKDLALLREVIDNRLDIVIASYKDYETPTYGFFSSTNGIPGDLPSLRDEMQKLGLKHELLQFGEFSLQAMGYFAE